jgi:hypothetical protein
MSIPLGSIARAELLKNQNGPFGNIFQGKNIFGLTVYPTFHK